MKNITYFTAILGVCGAALSARAELVYGVTQQQTLVSWDSAAPGALLTGMAIIGEPSDAILARTHVVYGGPLAIHLLSLELLLIWFPFGKLMHAVLFVFSRGATGIRFSHRGVKL